jgi:hypothetical protein
MADIQARPPTSIQPGEELFMLTVSGKVLGRKKPLFTDFSVPFPSEYGEGGITLRALIDRIVRDEVEAFRTRQQERRLLRALTAEQIADAAATGKIEMGESEVEPQHVDEDAAVATALQAFEDGLYLVRHALGLGQHEDCQANDRDGQRVSGAPQISFGGFERRGSGAGVPGAVGDRL